MNKVPNISVWLRMLRMKRSTSSYVTPMIGVPYIVIALAWVLLWFLWPHGIGVKRRPVVSPVRVAFVRYSEAAFSRPVPFPVGSAVTGTLNLVTVAPWQVPRTPRLLERKSGGDEWGGGRDEAFADRAGRELKAYRPVWTEPGLFAGPADASLHVTVEATGTLAGNGFQVPDFQASLKKTNLPWLVSAFVQVDKNGRVERVFLEAGCENRDINSLVVKALYRGRVSSPGTRCEGRVRVNYGQD